MALKAALAIVIAAASLPWLLSTAPARRLLLARANRILAPGGVEFATCSPSWFGPVEMTGFALIDPQGKRVVVAPRATLDRTLGQLVFDRPRFGTLRLPGAALDVERGGDGDVDIYEALRPILHPNPELDLTIRIDGGTLQVRAPGLAGPAHADHADIVLAIPPAPAPVAWKVDLTRGRDAVDGGSLHYHGAFHRWQSRGSIPPDLTLNVSARRWPLELQLAGLVAKAIGDGDGRLERLAGRWASAGEATVRDLDASGRRLAGDHPHLARLDAAWDLSRPADSSAWAFRKLEVNSAFGTLMARGALDATAPEANSSLEGRLDLATLAAALPHTLHLLEGLTIDRGVAEVRIGSREAGPGSMAWEVSARIADVVARHGGRAISLRDPAMLSGRILMTRDAFRVESLIARTPYLDLNARGDVREGICLEGNIDLAGLKGQLDDFVDLGKFSLEGRGRVEANYRPGARDGHYALVVKGMIDGLGVAGASVGPIRRDSAQATLSLSGQADPSGLPSGWSRLDVEATSGPYLLTSSVDHVDDSSAFVARARGPIGPGGGGCAVELDGNWSGSGVDLGRVSLAATRQDSPALTLSAWGRWDIDAGELDLHRTPGAATGLDLAAAGLRIRGLGWGTDWKAEASFDGDLATLERALVPWIGTQPAGLTGPAGLQLLARGDVEGPRIKASLDWSGVGDRAAPRSERAGYRATLDARYRPASDRFEVAECVLVGPLGTAEASGSLSEPLGRALIDVTGKMSPDWGAWNKLLSDRLEPEARVAGSARAFRLRGPLAGASAGERLAGLDGEVGVNLDGATLMGMRMGPARLVLRARNGRLDFDPIDTSLNNGRLRVDAELDFGDETRGPALRLASGTRVDDAEINDEVSRRVLAFVAPLLEDATRVRGRVSASVREARFPIGERATSRLSVDGSVVFRDVEFAPGPFADELIGVIGRELSPTLKLDRPVQLTIAEGKVHQRGLAVPLGNLSLIEIDGWVGLDRTLALTASLPLTPALMGNNPVLADIASGTKVKLPVGGTLDRPRLDRDALAVQMKDLGRTLLRRGAARGAAELILRLTRPDPPAPEAAPAPTTAQQRRRMRQERRQRPPVENDGPR